jgi:signal transduction histidine kinase
MKMITLTNIGNSYVEMGKYKKAERNLLQAIDYFDKKGLVRNQSGAYLYLAKLYQRWGDRQELALDYARRGLEKAKSIDNKQYIIEGYERLAEIYEDQKTYQQAYNLYKQFKIVQDSLLNSEQSTIINEMQTRFEVEQKDREIELLVKEAALKETQIAKQKLWRNFLIIGLVLLGVIGGLLYRYNNQKKRANLLLEDKNSEIERQNKKLVQLNEEKNEFLGMAAHDLRNPLSGIKSVASLLESDEKLTEEELQKYVEIIGLSADRMVKLIDNLLDVNAIENGSNHLNIELIDMHEPTKRAVNNFEKLAEKKEIRIKAQLNCDSMLVMADEDAVQRILENLISNAVKYSPRGSTVEVGTQLQENKMELSVKDEGPGIPEEEQQHLFKRYSRLSTKPTGNEGSTGLGLFIVKNLVEEMNGGVRCESQPGEGAEFIITLPIAAVEKNLAWQ